MRLKSETPIMHTQVAATPIAISLMSGEERLFARSPVLLIVAALKPM